MTSTNCPQCHRPARNVSYALHRDQMAPVYVCDHCTHQREGKTYPLVFIVFNDGSIWRSDCLQAGSYTDV